MRFKKGDIIWVNPEERDPLKIKHPAIIWNSWPGRNEFTGIMLTHSPPSQRFNNVLMKEEHFVPGQQITFNNTHFVNQLFIKFHDWGPFKKAGKLTLQGILFIKMNLTNTDATEFTSYVRSIAS